MQSFICDLARTPLFLIVWVSAIHRSFLVHRWV
jgi:hypothetical protein